MITADEKHHEENITFRVLSALGILFVVMGHMGYTLLEFETWFPFYSFHMALFAFISGYFYSSENDSHPGTFLIRKAKSLLVPFYAVSLFYLLLQTGLNKQGVTLGLDFTFYNWLIRPWVKCQPLGFNIATWYMIALFITEALYILLRIITGFIKSDKARNLLLLILLGAGSTLVITGSPYPEEWQRVWLRPVFLCFFCHLGYLYRNYAENRVRIPKGVLLAVILFIRFLLISNYGRLEYRLWDCNFWGLPGWAILLTTALGIAFWLIVAKIITPLVDRDGLLVRIGRHTREIMSHHLFAAFLWHGGIYLLHRVFAWEVPFHPGDWKTDLYFRYIPWKGFNLITVIACVGLVLFAVWLRDKCTAKAGRLLRRGNTRP